MSHSPNIIESGELGIQMCTKSCLESNNNLEDITLVVVDTVESEDSLQVEEEVQVEVADSVEFEEAEVVTVEEIDEDEEEEEDDEEDEEDEDEEDDEGYYDLKDMARKLRKAYEEEYSEEDDFEEDDIEEMESNLKEAEEMESLVNELIDAAQAKFDCEKSPTGQLKDSNKAACMPFSVGKLEDELGVPLVDAKKIVEDNPNGQKAVNFDRVWKIVRSNEHGNYACCTCVSWDEAIAKLFTIKNIYPDTAVNEFNIIEVPVINSNILN